MTDVRWVMRPVDAGQAIRIEYALTDDGDYALRRTTDADGTVTVERSAPLEDDWTPYQSPNFSEPDDVEWEVVSAPCACGCGCRAQVDAQPGEEIQRCPDSDDVTCDECATYYSTPGGEVVCGRVQDDATCRHCHQPIAWGPIRTRHSGCDTIDGECSCRTWRQEERGGEWALSEGEALS